MSESSVAARSSRTAASSRNVGSFNMAGARSRNPSIRPCVLAALVVAAVTVVAGAGAANGAPVKRLAWNKVAAVWTAQAKKKHHAVTCPEWRSDQLFFECVFYDAAISPASSTFIKDGWHRAYGKTLMARSDSCSYAFAVYGPDLRQSVERVVIDICVKGWLSKVPAAP